MSAFAPIASPAQAAPRVLIVDDSLTVRMDLNEALVAAGFAVALCADLAAARHALAGGCALVVLDVQLADGDGLGFLKELRSAPATRALPVLLLSSEAEVASRVRGMGAGADEYLGKPYDLRQLIARVRALVPAAPPPAGGPRVLVIDDSSTFRINFTEALNAAGYAVDAAASGEEGLAQAAARTPDAVVVDGVLPGIDGATVIRRLKSDAALRNAPCLLLTAADGTADELRALEAGADAYLSKGDDHGLILARLAALLRGAGATRAERASLLAPKRLLAVDDSPTWLHQLGEQLRQEGYDVVLARSGEEALELLAVQRVDGILMDCIMPGLSGEETCRRIKRAPGWRDIPLLMLTARDDRQAMIEGINAGADDWIAKSADPAVLKARLRAQLRRKHFEDETRRMREESLRRETEARFQRLIHSSIIGVVVGDLAGRLLDANDALLELLGRSRADLAAGRLSWAMLTPAEWAGRDRDAAALLHRQGSVPPYAKEVLRADGSRRHVEVGLVRLDGTDQVVGFVLDRSAQHAAEELLRQQAAALEQANVELAQAKQRAEQESRFKSRFLASMSHELRTPLNAVIGFSELLDQQLFGPLLPRQQEYVQNILGSGLHLLSLINEVLDLSKIEAGRMQLARAWTAVAGLVEAVRGIVEALALKRAVRLAIELAPNLPEALVDPVRVKQVLYNLLSNAIKFTSAGGQVTLSVHSQDGRLVITCRDTGVGIKAEDLPRLFREFERIEASGGERPEGTGLGLAVTRRLVELHGGSIAVDSTHAVGSTFTVILPVDGRAVAT